MSSLPVDLLADKSVDGPVIRSGRHADSLWFVEPGCLAEARAEGRNRGRERDYAPPRGPAVPWIRHLGPCYHRGKGWWSMANGVLDRITADPRKMGGVPCLRDLRVPVATIVGLCADGMSTAEILDAYPHLEAEDVAQALRFAAYLAKEREIPLIAVP